MSIEKQINQLIQVTANQTAAMSKLEDAVRANTAAVDALTARPTPKPVPGTPPEIIIPSDGIVFDRRFGAGVVIGESDPDELTDVYIQARPGERGLTFGSRRKKFRIGTCQIDFEGVNGDADGIFVAPGVGPAELEIDTLILNQRAQPAGWNSRPDLSALKTEGVELLKIKRLLAIGGTGIELRGLKGVKAQRTEIETLIVINPSAAEVKRLQGWGVQVTSTGIDDLLGEENRDKFRVGEVVIEHFLVFNDLNHRTSDNLSFITAESVFLKHGLVYGQSWHNGSEAGLQYESCNYVTARNVELQAMAHSAAFLTAVMDGEFVDVRVGPPNPKAVAAGYPIGPAFGAQHDNRKKRRTGDVVIRGIVHPDWTGPLWWDGSADPSRVDHRYGIWPGETVADSITARNKRNIQIERKAFNLTDPWQLARDLGVTEWAKGAIGIESVLDGTIFNA